MAFNQMIMAFRTMQRCCMQALHPSGDAVAHKTGLPVVMQGLVAGSNPPAYLAMRNEMVAAAVEATETTQTPGPTPNSSPAVIVSGTAGSASTSNAAYTSPYAGYLHIDQSCK